eukprot:3782682-Pleurochrysis_carterae.AAC.6
MLPHPHPWPRREPYRRRVRENVRRAWPRPRPRRVRASLLFARAADDVAPRDPLLDPMAARAASRARLIDGAARRRRVGFCHLVHLCRHRGGGRAGGAGLRDRADDRNLQHHHAQHRRDAQVAA